MNNPVRSGRGLRKTLLATTAFLGTALGAAPGWADLPAAIPPVPYEPPAVIGSSSSDPVTLNLIGLLVQQKIITQAQADALILQARQQARQQQARRPQQQTQPAPAATGAAGGAAAADGTVHVAYVPQVVQDQIRDQVKQQVMQQAKAENWAQPDQVPEWVRRIHLYGDFRFRYEADMFDKNNSTFVNFNAINTGSAYDISSSNSTLPPMYNTTKDRQRARVRARLGALAEISDNVTVDFELGTGNGLNPGSMNQTIGNDFTHLGSVIDQTYLNYRPWQGASWWFGRFANPWRSTDLIWANDLRFDGIAVSQKFQASRTVEPFLTVGAFPVWNTTFNLPQTPTANSDGSINESSSHDTWLYAAQTGVGWKPSKKTEVNLAAAYYYFGHIQGSESSACLNTPTATTSGCSTDWSRPVFGQWGNTLFPIRNITYATGTTADPQYFGLASPFHELAITAGVDYTLTEAVHIMLDGEAETNLGFNRKKMKTLLAETGLVNNYGANTSALETGDSAFMVKLTAGTRKITERGQWNASLAYKYIEADSVVDAFNDQDFHLGGTNAKGYIVGAELGLAHDFWATASYYSATQISGSPLAIDVVHVDLNARF